MSKILRTLQRLEESRERLRPPPAAAAFGPLEIIRPETPPRAARLLPIASGKGGVGKTNFAVSLSLALAESLRGTEARVLLLDADFGLPNADLLLGCRPEASLDDVAAKRVASLADAVSPTGHPNLGFLGGSAAPSATLANLDYRTRKRFRRHIDSLSAAFIVLDLGAGVSDEVTEFVSMTNSAVFVTTPEPPARRDAFLLIRGALLRRLRDEAKDLPEVEARLKRAAAADPTLSSVPDVLLSLREDGRRLEEKIVREILARYRPWIVVNRAESAREGEETFRGLEDRCRHELGVRPEYLGAIPDDRAVVEAVKAGRPFLFHAPESAAARALAGIAARLEREEAFGMEENYFSFSDYIRKIFRRKR